MSREKLQFLAIGTRTARLRGAAVGSLNARGWSPAKLTIESLKAKGITRGHPEPER